MVRLKSIAILRVMALAFMPVSFEAMPHLMLQASWVLAQDYVTFVRYFILAQHPGPPKLVRA